MLKQNLNKIIAVFIITIGTIFIAGCGDSIPEGMDAGASGPEDGEDPDAEGSGEGSGEGDAGADPGE
jgi:hypothetical protein